MDNMNIEGGNIRASSVTGTNVYNTAGESLGAVEDVVIGKTDGKAKYAIMSFGGFLGLGEEYHPVPWDNLKYDQSQNGYVVNMTREQLEGAPRYDQSAEPDWNDRAYQDQVGSYYGAIPPM